MVTRERFRMDQVQNYMYNRIESPTCYLCCSTPDFRPRQQSFRFEAIQTELALCGYLDRFILADWSKKGQAQNCLMHILSVINWLKELIASR